MIRSLGVRARRPLLGGKLPRVLAALVGLSLLGAEGCEPRVRTYGLSADSTFTQGCFPPLLCVSLLPQNLGGTFRLVERVRLGSAHSEFFDVQDVFWLVRFGGEDIPITGRGSYLVEHAPERSHQLTLDLAVGDAEPETFDSGLVPVESDGFPDRLDVRISLHGERFFDTVIDVRALAFPTRRPSRTPCGPGLSCDPKSEVCVAKTPVGPAIVYSCEPVPDGCERDCGCAGASLCTAPFLACSELPPNRLICDCLQCQ